MAALSFASRAGLVLAALGFALIIGIGGTEGAIANGDTRTLSLYNNNTKESLTVTFRRDGQYDPGALEQLNWFLRDWRKGESIRMDPRLFDTVWEVYREVGSSAPIQVNSGYRSPTTNAMLRRRGGIVAKNSQHMLGKAMDFYLSDVPAEQVRAIGMRLQRGGVGYYPTAYTPFIHLDVGSVRAWPRMTREQLVRIFPDGKTVHIPSDGTPLAGYEEAKAEVLARGGTVSGYTTVASNEDDGGAAQPHRKSFWAMLFGGSDEDEDVEEIRAASHPGRNVVASRDARPRSSVPDADASPTSVLEAYNEARAQPAQLRPQPAIRMASAEAESELNPPRAVMTSTPLPENMQAPPLPPLPPTRIAGLPATIETPSGPQLAWQQGPAGLNLGPDNGLGRESGLTPLPPRRPDDVTVTGALAYAPMPPARPAFMAAGNPILPELKDTSHAAEAVQAAVGVPLPPPRPGLHSVMVASAGSDIPALSQFSQEPLKGAKGKPDRPALSKTASKEKAKSASRKRVSQR